MAEQFYATFPCYVLAGPPFRSDSDDEMLVDGDNNFLVQHSDETGRQAIPAFTDRHLAQTFMFENGLCGTTLMIPIPTKEYFSTLLKSYKEKRDREADLVFDQSKSWAGWLVTYAEATLS